MIRRDIRGGSSEHETQNGGLRNFFIKSVGETTNLNQSSDCTPSFFPNRWPYTMDTRPKSFSPMALRFVPAHFSLPTLRPHFSFASCML
jgi:hypothetical protein